MNEETLNELVKTLDRMTRADAQSARSICKKNSQDLELPAAQRVQYARLFNVFHQAMRDFD